MAPGIPARLTAPEGRKFGLTVGAAFLLLAAITLWRGHPIPMRIFTVVGTALLVAGLAIPTHLAPVYRAWMGLAHAMSRVTTPVFMGVVFFVVLAPIGIVMRIFGRNPMRREAVNQSYWAAPNQLRGSLKNQF